jgi:hypothetical protein
MPRRKKKQTIVYPPCPICRGIGLVPGPWLKKGNIPYPSMQKCAECGGTGKVIPKEEAPQKPTVDYRSLAAGEGREPGTEG